MFQPLGRQKQGLSIEGLAGPVYKPMVQLLADVFWLNHRERLAEVMASVRFLRASYS